MMYNYQPIRSNKLRILVADPLKSNIFTMKFLMHSMFKLSEEMVTYT